MTMIATCLCGPRLFRAPSPMVMDAAVAAKFDPTGTLDLRARFKREMDLRWNKVRKLTTDYVDRNEALGLHGVTAGSILHGLHSPGGDAVRVFQSWIDEAMRQVVLGGDGSWVATYIEMAAERAAVRASKLTWAKIDEGSETAKRLKTLVALTITELQGVCEAVSQQTVRALAAGLLSHQRPSKVAREVSMRILSVGRARGRLIAETMVVRTFSSATLDAFRSAGVRQVGTQAERVRVVKGLYGKTLKRDSIHVHDVLVRDFRASKKKPSASAHARIVKREAKVAALGEVDVLTAGDEDVCEECQDISDSGPYDIDEAEGLIPAHVNCRCAFVPTKDERFAEVGDAFNPDEQRDPHGEWSGGGSGYVFHGTPSKNIEAIRKEGLKPNGYGKPIELSFR